jgi:hypothetical protein
VPTAMQRATDRTISICRLWDLIGDSFMRCEGMIARLPKAFMTNAWNWRAMRFCVARYDRMKRFYGDQRAGFHCYILQKQSCKAMRRLWCFDSARVCLRFGADDSSDIDICRKICWT